MSGEIDLTSFDNPAIQVVWEDLPENFTQDKIKSVKHYFQKKYNSTNVNIITKVKPIKDEITQTVDVSINIMDTNYQIELLKQFLKSKGFESQTDDILNINKMVENKMLESQDEGSSFKKWYIKNIEFSNFLSYGENQKIDFDKCNGITVIESNPRNFGGKCVRYNTEIDVEFDVDYIVNKLGFLPDELNEIGLKTITLKDCYDLFNKYGNLGIKVNTPYGYKNINGCEITEPNGVYLKMVVEDGSYVEGSLKHKIKTKNGKFIPLSELEIGQEVQTTNGNQKIISLINEGLSEDLYDIEVDEVRQYYTNGIVSHNSVLSIDLIMFLFFNETTKTTKAEEIFNRFTDKNKVSVKGEIIIDGEEYIIERNIERKLSKKGDWNVKTELDFFKKLSDGSLQNFTGEQRRETENFIKTSIGTKEDFLLTILTTATNLEELLESKPTARGQVLSKFMGLEFLKKKEETAKEIYSEYSKSMLSNIYSTSQLNDDNAKYEGDIVRLNDEIKIFKTELGDIESALVKGKDYRDDMLKKKHSDIDKEISLTNPDNVRKEIESITNQKNDVLKKLDEIKVVEPSSYYHENEHDKIKELYDIEYRNKVEVENKIKSIEELKSSVSGGIICQHCGIDLMNASITQSKIEELDGFIQQKERINELMIELSGKEQSFVDLKKQFDEYEKNKLIKEKYDISIETFDLKIGVLNDKLNKYEELQDKIKENEKIETLLIKAGMRIDELELNKNKKQTSINNNIYQISTLEEKIKTNLQTIIKISEESEKEKLYKIYLEAFGKNGISKIIMKTMMPLINSELQRLMVDSSYFKLEIRINDKNEVEFMMIDNGTGVEKLMVSGSGYERTIASLALRSVLTKICSLPKPNIVVMDEVFGKISDDNLEMVWEFFVKIKEYFEKIFVITHNPMVSQWADTIINIKKEDNISKIYQ